VVLRSAVGRPADARDVPQGPGGPGGSARRLRPRRAFLNICRHRGAQICTEDSDEVKRAFQCPYHAWTYDLSGKLVAAPNLTKMPDIDRVQYGLVPVHLREWLGYAWVCLAEQPPSFEDDVMGAIADRLGDLESIDGYELDSLTPGVDEDHDRRCYAITVRPTVFVNLVPDHVIFHRMFPVSVDRTIVECDWLYTREVVESGQDVSRSVELFHRVNEQDFAACERTQPAMSSRAYANGGVLVASEHHIGEFHHWLRQRLADCRRTTLPLASRQLAASLRTGPTPCGAEDGVLGPAEVSVAERYGATELCPSHGEVASVGGDDEAVALESLQVQEGGPTLDRLDERQPDVRPVHQPVGDDVRQRSWLP
jgi:nitrite reductase/ring-hydroxylating ferredoxin subunit